MPSLSDPRAIRERALHRAAAELLIEPIVVGAILKAYREALDQEMAEARIAERKAAEQEIARANGNNNTSPD